MTGNNQQRLFSDNEMFENAKVQEYDVWFRSGCMEPDCVVLVSQIPQFTMTTTTGYRVIRVKARDKQEAVWVAKMEVYKTRTGDLECLVRDKDRYIERLNTRISQLEYYEKTIKNSLIGWLFRTNKGNK